MKSRGTFNPCKIRGVYYTIPEHQVRTTNPERNDIASKRRNTLGNNCLLQVLQNINRKKYPMLTETFQFIMHLYGKRVQEPISVNTNIIEPYCSSHHTTDASSYVQSLQVCSAKWSKNLEKCHRASRRPSGSVIRYCTYKTINVYIRVYNKYNNNNSTRAVHRIGIRFQRRIGKKITFNSETRSDCTIKRLFGN